MPSSAYAAIFRSEEQYKEKVYNKFDEMLTRGQESVNKRQERFNAGAYEDQAGFMLANDLASQKEDFNEDERLVELLYRTPYFSHIKAKVRKKEDPAIDEDTHFFLSNCESLEKELSIDRNGFLLPFKLNPKRPVSSALYRCYTMKEGKTVSYRSDGDEYDVTPKAIYEDTIDRRRLLKADQVYPVSDFAQWMADE